MTEILKYGVGIILKDILCNLFLKFIENIIIVNIVRTINVRINVKTIIYFA